VAEEVKAGFLPGDPLDGAATRGRSRTAYRVVLGVSHDAACEDAGAANGWLPVHLLSELDRYAFDALPAESRNKVRKCWKTNEIAQVHRADGVA
jgi:hypothetical protein